MADFERKLKEIRMKDLWKAIGEQDIMKLRSQLGIVNSSRFVILKYHKNISELVNYF